MEIEGAGEDVEAAIGFGADPCEYIACPKCPYKDFADVHAPLIGEIEIVLAHGLEIGWDFNE